MSYKYWLPDAQGRKQEYETESNAVIIIGANGSGKSKLGAWIEKQNFDSVHRIAAQRSLNFSEDIPLERYTKAENVVFYGDAGGNGPYRKEKGGRWGWGDQRQYTTRMIDDFNSVLAALFARKNNENDDFVGQCKEAEKVGIPVPHTPTTVIDKLRSIWSSVLPERSLIDNDSKFFAVFDLNGSEVRYSATQMSDGERAVLYLSAQVLCVPTNKILIIDEPELHLHRSIMTRLWSALEQQRPDCLFIYITHDTQFAAEHVSAEKIWIKEYNGLVWKLQQIENDLPEALLLDILGSRKNVLFVEGERDSYDTKLYTELYPNYHIVSCGSCTQVIARTKAFRSNLSLHDCEVYGLIDRDYRSDYEIDAYKNDHIYTLNVAEVENLFVVEELVRLMANHMCQDADTVFDAVKKYVVEERFARELNKQICESVVAEIKYKLACAEISKKNNDEAKASLQTALDSIDFDAIYQTQETAFQEVLNRADYKEVLKHFNQKSISKTIGQYFGIANSAYRDMIIAMLRGNKHKEIVTAIKPYLPVEIPFEGDKDGT